MAGVPYIFGNATTSIPLTNLDANFNTGLTIGNTTVGLGNTVTTLGNVTLNNANFGGVANAVIYTNSSGNVTSNVSIFSVSPISGNVQVGNAPGSTNPFPTKLNVKGPATDPTASTYGGLFGLDTIGSTAFQMGIGSSFNGTWMQSYNEPAGTSYFDLVMQPLGGTILFGCTAAPDATISGIRLLNPVTGASRFSSGNTSASTNMINFYNSNGVVGTINTNGLATLYITSSDYRLKENVAPMTGALATISQLKPVTYDWKNGGSSQGFIAHELQAIVPECVVGTKDAVDEDGNIDPQGIDTSFLVATLTAAIQELKAIVDTQANQISALQAKVGV